MTKLKGYAVAAALAVVLSACGASAGPAPSATVSPAGRSVTLALVVSYSGIYPFKYNAKNAPDGSACSSFSFKPEMQEVQVLDNAEALLSVGEFPRAGTWAWTGNKAGQCTYTTTPFGGLPDSPVYVVRTAMVGDLRFNSADFQGTVTVPASDGSLWVFIGASVWKPQIGYVPPPRP